MFILQRANYQMMEWKKPLIANHVYVEPVEHRWQRKGDGLIEIKWIMLNASPDSLLEFTVCNCKKSQWKTNACKCKKFKLKYTDLFWCKDCNNQEEKLIESDHEGSDESENEESDVRDDESVFLTDSDYDDDFWTDNYYSM